MILNKNITHLKPTILTGEGSTPEEAYQAALDSELTPLDGRLSLSETLAIRNKEESAQRSREFVVLETRVRRASFGLVVRVVLGEVDLTAEQEDKKTLYHILSDS